jgi:hypothetical protein
VPIRPHRRPVGVVVPGSTPRLTSISASSYRASPDLQNEALGRPFGPPLPPGLHVHNQAHRAKGQLVYGNRQGAFGAARFKPGSTALHQGKRAVPS